MAVRLDAAAFSPAQWQDASTKRPVVGGFVRRIEISRQRRDDALRRPSRPSRRSRPECPMLALRRIEVSFQDCRIHVTGRSSSLRLRPLRGGGKRGGAHALHEQREQHLRVEPRGGGFVQVVGQPIESAERLPSLEEQLDLAAQLVERETSIGVQPGLGHRREEHDVGRCFTVERGDLRAELAVRPRSCFLGLRGAQAHGDQAAAHVAAMLVVVSDDFALVGVMSRPAAHQHVRAVHDHPANAGRVAVAAIAERQLALMPREALESLADRQSLDAHGEEVQVGDAHLHVRPRIGRVGSRIADYRGVHGHHFVSRPPLRVGRRHVDHRARKYGVARSIFLCSRTWLTAGPPASAITATV